MFVLQYIVSSKGKTSTLTPTREWQPSSARVITALGAQTVAHLAVRNGISPQTVYQIVEGQEAPTIVVPSALLRLDNVKYRIADNGTAMAVRKASQKATQAYNRAAGNALRAFGLKGF